MDKSIITVEDATNSLKNKKAVFVITNLNDMVNIMGYIEYISDTEETYDKMVDIYRKISQSGRQAMLIGSYGNGGAIGVQYEV